MTEPVERRLWDVGATQGRHAGTNPRTVRYQHLVVIVVALCLIPTYSTGSVSPSGGHLTERVDDRAYSMMPDGESFSFLIFSSCLSYIVTVPPQGKSMGFRVDQ